MHWMLAILAHSTRTQENIEYWLLLTAVANEHARIHSAWEISLHLLGSAHRLIR